MVFRKVLRLKVFSKSYSANFNSFPCDIHQRSALWAATAAATATATASVSSGAALPGRTVLRGETEPNNDGLQPTSNGLQPTSNGLQPTSNGLQPDLVAIASNLIAMASNLLVEQLEKVGTIVPMI